MSWLSRFVAVHEPAHLRAGKWGEEQAERYLKKQGYRILGRRVRVGVKDELDLVVKQGEVLVFVEVKTRKSEDFGRPFTAVNKAKRQHLSRAAIHLLTRLKPAQRPAYFRFDVVEVVGEPGAPPHSVRHIEHAFTMAGGYRLPW
jgi:putative endonuclease